MALVNIEQIKVNRIVQGVVCPECGGEFGMIKKKGGKEIFWKMVTLGVYKVHNYECKNCKKKYRLY